MDRKKAQEHLSQFGLSVSCPNKAEKKTHYHKDAAVLLSVTSGLCSPYRLTSAFGPRVGNWVYWHIKREFKLCKALRKAAEVHPLYNKK